MSITQNIPTLLGIFQRIKNSGIIEKTVTRPLKGDIYDISPSEKAVKERNLKEK
jgi:hypothetical protein